MKNQNLLLVLLIAPIPFIGSICRGYSYDSLIPLLVLFGVVGLGILFRKSPKSIEWNRIDLFAFLYWGYGLIHMFYIKPIAVDPIRIYEWWGLGIYYLFVRSCAIKVLTIRIGIFLGGVLQAVFGLCQYMEIVSSNHSSFPVTGSFPNPAPFAIYLVVALLMGIGLDKYLIDKSQKILFRTTCCLILFLIIVADSRAAFLALLFGGGYLFFVRKGLLHSKLIRSTLVPLVLLMFILVLYTYRPDSANARLFIWKTSVTQLIPLTMFWGGGEGSFHRLYMDVLSDGVENVSEERQPESLDHAHFATNNSFAFSEPIRVICEQGFGGGILLLLMYLALFTRSGPLAIHSSLLALLLFSFFSYPYELFPTKIFFPILIASEASARPSHRHFRVRIPHFCGIISLLILLIALQSFSLYRYNRRVEIEIGNLYYDESDDARQFLHTNYQRFQTHRRLLLSYTKVLKEDPSQTDLKVFEYLVSTAPSSEILCDLGSLYAQYGDTKRAEFLFIRASKMCPKMMRPMFERFLLYRSKQEIEKAVRQARLIINQTVKIENQLTRSMRQEAETYLRSIENKKGGVSM